MISPQGPNAGQSVDKLAGDRDQQEVKSDHRRGRQGVGDSALEDEIDIHQAITNDGPTEGQRQDDQRDGRELGEGIGYGICQPDTGRCKAA